MHYDVIYHPFPINSQYLKTWGVGSPALNVFPTENLIQTNSNGFFLKLFTVHEVVSVLCALRCHGLDAILDRPGTLCLNLMCSVFSSGSWYLFCDTLLQMKRWRFSVYHGFFYSFSRSFQLSFFIIGNFHSHSPPSPSPSNALP